MMKHKGANVIVYVKQPVEQVQVKQISKSVSNLHGVVHSEVSNWARSFFSVDYDPASTNSKHILEHVNSQGYNAVLVGI